MRKTLLALTTVSLLSCGEDRPAAADKKSGDERALAAAQLALAKNHLGNSEPLKAIPYLRASIAHDRTDKAETLLKETLSSTAFTIPVIELRHPFPVLRFEETGRDLIVAVGGDWPTVIRWSLTDEPSVSAILFPAKGREITHLSLSPDSRYLLVHRDGLNLLCNAQSLKPIAALDPFPEGLDPETCQPFSAHSLLVASPSDGVLGNTVWRIRDTATGEILRSESMAALPKPAAAEFEDTSLLVRNADGNRLRIPLVGEAEPLMAAKGGKGTIPIGSRIRAIGADTLAVCESLLLEPDEAANMSDDTLAALTGYRLDPATQSLVEIPVPNRLETLARDMPGRFPETLRAQSAETPLTLRFAAARPEEFPILTAASRAHATIIRETFASGEPAAILSAIDAAQPGLPLATALHRAIESGNGEFIERALSKADDIPPALEALAKGRVEGLADFDHLRRVEDWLGYESPDFQPLLDKLRGKQASALTAIALPENPTADDVTALTERLLDPATLETLGSQVLSEKALAAARLLSEKTEHAATAIQLAGYAQRLGQPAASTLRIRAAAFTTLSDFKNAHAAWIDLITHQPEADHIPSDYTEAAYTAFETGDARQAIEILNTGIFRFPNDPSSAIRSGWIALLTDHTEDALRYLKHATKLGLPPAEIENATALLAIAHERIGEPDLALSHLAQLKAISPKWADAASLEKLPWPEPLKETLRGIISRDAGTEPLPSPESDPTDTVPLPGGFPIEEPPLPSR